MEDQGKYQQPMVTDLSTISFSLVVYSCPDDSHAEGKLAAIHQPTRELHASPDDENRGDIIRSYTCRVHEIKYQLQ